jgi:hypothetical protein
MEQIFNPCLCQVLPFILRLKDYSGAAAVPEAEPDKASFSASRASSRPFRQWLIGGIYRSCGHGGTFTGHDSVPFSPGARMLHPHESAGHNRMASDGERAGEPSPAFRLGAVAHAQGRPEVPAPGVSLPGLFDTVPSSGRPGGYRTGCVPPLSGAEFGQRVLYGCGPAQVGFGALCLLPPFRHLTVWVRRLT